MKFSAKKTILCSFVFGWISLFWGSYDAIMQSINYDVFQLNSVWHGVILAADNILALFLLPLFGKLSDASHSRFGRRKPFIVVGTIIAMLGFSGVCVFASLGKDYFLPFILCLLITLSAMAAFRSPGLALVPDINPDKFRSRANAISNVVSVIMTVVAMGFFFYFMRYSGYYAVGFAIIGTTLAMLIFFCFAVKERKFNSDMAKESSEAQEAALQQQKDKQLNNQLHEQCSNSSQLETFAYSRSHALDVQSFTEDSLLHLPNIEFALRHEYRAVNRLTRLEALQDGLSKKEIRTRARKTMLFNHFVILTVVFCFYMAYNALTSNFIKYAEVILGFKQNDAIVPLIIAQVAAMLSFPIASALSTKIGRKSTVFVGFLLMLGAFASTTYFTTPNPALYFIFVVLGVSFGFVMVNIYPFFLESSPQEKVGVYTGYFSVAMTVAMVITPILSGALISVADGWFGGGLNAGFRILFPYSIVFLALACIFTLLIKTKKQKDCI